MKLTVPVPLTLTPLGAEDEAMLCGRTAEVESIVLNCQSSRLTVITSTHGMGASSLLRAGAEPALKREGYLTIVFSDWQSRKVAIKLRSAILRAIHEQADGGFYADAEHEPLKELLSRAQSKINRPIAVLLDQFEDYVRCHVGTDVSDEFDAELANAISSRAARFVIALQTPSVTAFERLGQYIPNLMGFTIDLPPLTADAAKEVISKTAANSEIEIEPKAADEILAAPVVKTGNGIHPVYLTLAIQRLCDAETVLKSKKGRASTLELNGGVDQLVLTSLDIPIQELGVTHSELFFRWITLLISRDPDHHRLAASEKALMEHSGKLNRFAMALLPALIKSGLMRSIAIQAGVRVEFARESTTRVIQDWWMRNEAAIVARQRAQFRVRSISIAVGAIVAAYIVYLIFGK